MAHTRVKVIEIVQKYLQLQRDLREFKDNNFIWLPDEWVFRTKEAEETYKEMEKNFQNFIYDEIVIDMEGNVFNNLN